MANEFFFASSFDLAEFAIAANIDEVRSYWTGGAWDDDFNNAATYSLTADTLDGIDGFTGSIDTNITDPLTLTILCWEDDVTPALGDQAAEFDVLWTGTDIGTTAVTVVSAGSTTIGASVAADLTLKLWQNRDYPTSSGQCPAWSISDYNAALLTAATLYLYPIEAYEDGNMSSYSLFQVTGSPEIAQSGDDTVIKIPLTDTETGALDGNSVNLPTHVYQLFVTTTGGDKLHVAEQVVRVVQAA